MAICVASRAMASSQGLHTDQPGPRMSALRTLGLPHRRQGRLRDALRSMKRRAASTISASWIMDEFKCIN